MLEPSDLRRDFHDATMERCADRAPLFIAADIGAKEAQKPKRFICLISRETADKSSIKGDPSARNNNRHLSRKIYRGSFYGWISNERVQRAKIGHDGTWHFVSKI